MEFLSTQSFLILLISFMFLYLYFQDLFKRRNNKGFEPYPILGSLRGLIHNRNRHLDWLTENINTTPNNTALFRRIGINTSVMTADPRNVEHVLKSDFENHPKGGRFVAALADLFVSNGDAWRVQRKALSRAMTVEFFRGFVAEKAVAEVSNLLVPALEKASDDQSGIFDLQKIFQRFAFRIACKITFSSDIDDEKFMMAFDEASGIVAGRLRCPFHFTWKFKKLVNIGSERRLKTAIRYFHAGPRMCLGKDMAYFQIKFVAATVIERLVVAVKGRDDQCPPRHSLGFTLRMEEGLNVTVKKRCQLSYRDS